jgi:hypothetical protein
MTATKPRSLAALIREAGLNATAFRSPVVAALLRAAGVPTAMVGGLRIVLPADVAKAREVLADLKAQTGAAGSSR